MRIFPSKFLLALAACLLATACTGQSPTTSDDEAKDDGKPQTLRWLIEEPEDAAAIKALKEHIATFEKDSGIKVNLSTLPFENMRTILQTQLRSGEGPDVFNWGAGPASGGALAKNGLLYDLTDAYGKYDWPVFGFAKERVTYDGKIYGIPGEMETVGLFYNKDIFKELNLEEPKSLDDLKAVADAITKSGRVALAVGDKEGWEGGHLLSMALSSAIGSEPLGQMINGEKSWDSPEVVAALKVWGDFNKAGYLPKSPTSVGYDSSTALFFSGKAAMIPTGSWLVGEIDDNAKFEAGYIPFPAPDGPGIFTGGLGSGPFVSVGTKKTEEALEFLDFLASPEHARWTVENLHSIPAVPVETEGLKVSPLLAQVLEDTATLGRSGDFGHNIDVLVDEAVNEAMWDGVQGIFTGQKTPEQVAADMQAAAQK